MDFESIQFSPAVVSVLSEGGSRAPDGYRARFASEETALCTRRMVQSLGLSLGSKRVSQFVDALMADLFQSAVHRVESGHSLYNASHAVWLHEWVGSAILAREVGCLTTFR